MPVSQEDNAPVTVDLNGQAVVRARAPGQSRITELLLARSQASDPPVRFCINREFLARALHLGFTDIAVVKPDAPLVCQDERRQFVIMPLGQDMALPPQEDGVQISSTGGGPPTKQGTSERRRTMKTPSVSSTTNGNGIGQPKTDAIVIPKNANDVAPPSSQPVAIPRKINASGLDVLLAEAEALRSSLRDAYARSNQLLLAIKRHKKQAYAVRATLASLHQLQHLDA